MKTTFIYSLSCPIDGTIKYIGKANNPKSRLYEHRRMRDNNLAKNLWIKSLIDQNLLPILNIIEEVLISDWKDKEKFYISQYKDLLNICGGANGSYFGNKGSFNGDHARKVISLNKNGSFNKEYSSVKDAILEYGSGITSVLSGKTKTAYGYIWIYKDVYEKLASEEIEKIENDASNNMSNIAWKNGLIDYQFKKGNHPLNTKEVHQYTVDGVYLKSWISCAEASLNVVGTKRSHISMCANGKRNKAYGFKWSYKKI